MVGMFWSASATAQMTGFVVEVDTVFYGADTPTPGRHLRPRWRLGRVRLVHCVRRVHQPHRRVVCRVCRHGCGLFSDGHRRALRVSQPCGRRLRHECDEHRVPLGFLSSERIRHVLDHWHAQRGRDVRRGARCDSEQDWRHRRQRGGRQHLRPPGEQRPLVRVAGARWNRHRGGTAQRHCRGRLACGSGARDHLRRLDLLRELPSVRERRPRPRTTVVH